MQTAPGESMFEVKSKFKRRLCVQYIKAISYMTYRFIRCISPDERSSIKSQKGAAPLADYPSSSWPLGLQYRTSPGK